MQKLRTKLDMAFIKAYLLVALFNAGATMVNYYRAKVNHDMVG